ncbi:MAG: hypothetical protein K0Q73_5960 [Paenibacillus sp.]|nr:hypothetical protein [Paenibacillus sp.]
MSYMNKALINLTEGQIEDLLEAKEQNKAIIVGGPQGPTGKTTLVNYLRSQGFTAFETWETHNIQLNKLIDLKGGEK